jgi:hypothetical protein
MALSVKEARDYMASTTPDNDPKDRFIHSAYVDRYNEGSDDDKRRLVDAMEALLTGGVDWEQKMAAAFFKTVGAAADVLDRLLAHYAQHGGAPIADLLGHSWYALNAAQAAAARSLFVHDPTGQIALAAAALVDDDGSAWDALARTIATSDDAAVLAAAFEGAYSASREDDFFAAMKSRPAPLVRATAALMSATSSSKLLDACGVGRN